MARPAQRDNDAMSVLLSRFKSQLAALANRVTVPVGKRWRLAEDAASGNLIAEIPSTGYRIALGTPSGVDCGALLDCLVAHLGPGLEWDAERGLIVARLSTDAGNTLAVGTDEGLYSAAAPAGTTPLAGPLLWYRASDVTANDGANVTAWPSALTGGPALAATTAPPLMRLTTSIPGRKGVEFAHTHPGGWMAGNGDHMFVPTSPGFSMVTHGGCTIFAVYSNDTGAGGPLGLQGPAASIAPRTHYFLTNPPPADGSYLWRNYGSPLTDGLPHVHEWRYSQTNVLYRRGGADMAETGNDDSPNPLVGRDTDAIYNTAAGGTFGFSLGELMNGILWELRIYDGVLSGAGLAQVRAELAATYGLPT